MTRASGFWGLVVEPSKLYSQQVPATFKITMASLGSNKELEATANGKSQRTSLIFNLDSKEDFTLCSLTNDKIEQQALDLVLTEGETIAFRVEGPHTIHLSGYYINDEEDEDDGFINDEDEDEIYSDEAEEDSQIEYDSEEDDEDFDSEEESEEEMTKNPRIRVIESEEEEEEMDSDEEMSEDDEEMDSEFDSEEESEEEPEEEVEQAKSSKKVKFDLTEAKKAKETPKEQVKAASPAKEQVKTAAPAKVTPPPAKATPAVASPQNNKEQAAAQASAPAPVKKTLPSGLQIEDLKLGNGPKVSNGKKVLIHYKGTLLNGQVFDSSFGGKPLKFAVGKGDVIKGMDIGIVGMAIGGSRKLVIPGPLAYGNQALPKIPRNSTLVFEIRLEKIL